MIDQSSQQQQQKQNRSLLLLYTLFTLRDLLRIGVMVDVFVVVVFVTIVSQKLLEAASTTAATAATTATATATASSGAAVSGVHNSATAGRNTRVDVDVDVDINVDVGIAAAMETITMATCYHGSTAENVATGSPFRMIIDEYLTMVMNLAGKNPTEVSIMVSDFNLKHKEMMINPQCNPCVFAVCTDIFLNSYRSEAYPFSKQKQIQDILCFGINTKYLNSPLVADKEKGGKYYRDIMTNRGIINVLDRETNSFCNCMKPYKEETKTMGKTGICVGCRQEFPKMQLKRCSRCLAVPYCSNKCMKKNWFIHKQFCKPHNEQKSEKQF